MGRSEVIIEGLDIYIHKHKYFIAAKDIYLAITIYLKVSYCL
jgi:hypothetical protein